MLSYVKRLQAIREALTDRFAGELDINKAAERINPTPVEHHVFLWFGSKIVMERPPVEKMAQAIEDVIAARNETIQAYALAFHDVATMAQEVDYRATMTLELADALVAYAEEASQRNTSHEAARKALTSKVQDYALKQINRVAIRFQRARLDHAETFSLN